MKRGTTPTLKIQLVGLDIEEAIKIEFLFKQTLDEDCQQKVKKIFIANDEDSPVQYENHVANIGFFGGDYAIGEDEDIQTLLDTIADYLRKEKTMEKA